MWINPFFNISHRAEALDIVRENPLATLIGGDGGGARVSHMPLIIEEMSDGSIELVGHIPRADPISKDIEAGNTITSVFQGPQSYVSPEWYVDPGLPTYNFLVAHLVGVPKVMKSDEELRAHLIDLIMSHEGRCPVTSSVWSPDIVADARINELLPLIVGFRVLVDQLQAKAKLGQNRSVADQISAAHVLNTSPRTGDHVIAQLMLQSSEMRAAEESGK